MKLTIKRLRKMIKEELDSRKAPFEPHRSSSPGVSLDAMNAADDEGEVDQTVTLSDEEKAVLAKLLDIAPEDIAADEITIRAAKLGPLKRALAMGPDSGDRRSYDDVLGKLS
jgi:hypothetical protein